MAILCQALSVFGVFANIINIVVFCKQGFQDAMTVTLTGLAVADLGIATCAVWLSICYNPLFQQLELPFLPLQIVYLTAGLPRLSCSRVSSWVLALATFERCLCIAMPFKVREIITPGRSLAFVIGVFITMTASVAPIYYTSRTAQKFDEAANRSYLVLSFTEDREKVDAIAFGIGVTFSVCSFVAVAICTAVLVYSLKKTSKWRDSNTSTAQVKKRGAKEISSKNKRASKMVSLISTIFIVCYLPNTINQLVMSLVPDYAKNGRYINTNQVFWSVGFVAESFNCSVNIFMYYTMSTKFRSTLQSMGCGRCLSPGTAGKSAMDDEDGSQKVKKVQK
ncbi:hypothetical protein EGW08_022523 [Elysia chlorotica]|uniref:G-protein coupled receptors family 1 profile domain-containing protein n=1 Tax=Elysia chlorotica TaxID=188477 RepID=A0A3S1AVW8_ELYCH|nr:hypothetical protein EGW08_022523 [Elysia chlorotica]